MEQYRSAPRRVLVLGESWYGEIEDLSDYIRRWAARSIGDRTYSRIYNSGAAKHTSKSKPADLLQFWNQIAFYNFVPGSVGPTNGSKANKTHFKAAAAFLPPVLDELQPHGVWILGVGQAEYSRPVIEAAGIAHEMAPHPTSRGLRSIVLQDSWRALQLRMN